MPGVYGVCCQHASVETAIIADRMRLTMRHAPWHFDSSFVEPSGRIACGRVSLRASSAGTGQPRGRQSAVVMLDGEIYDYAERRRELEAEGLSFATIDHAELLAHGFGRWGEMFFTRIEGFFSAAVWRPDAHVLLLVTDRFGMKPLYYSIVPDGLVFASEIKALLEHRGVSRKHSLKGIAQFFTYGHFLGDDTLFENVRLVPAATVVTYDVNRGGVGEGRYWQLNPGEPIGDATEALARIDAAFGRAVVRRITGPGQLGLSLSGGLDARTILAAVPRGATHVKSMSVGITGSIDHRVASQLAALAGTEHHCQLLKSGFLSQFPFHLRKLVYLTDGHYLDQAITVPTLPMYRELGIDTLLRGHAGELLHMDKAYAFSIRGDELRFANGAALEQWLWSHLTAYMIGGIGHEVFRPALRADVATLARQALADALSQSDGWRPQEQRLWHLFVHERLRRETAMSMQMFSSVVDVRLPYMDAAFIETTMQVAPRLKLGDTIQSYILARRFPAFLDVINANTGTTPGRAMIWKRIATTRLKALSKLGVAGYQPYERLGLWLRYRLKPFVCAMLLSDRSVDRGFFDPEVLRRMIDDHHHRRKNHTFLLMALLIFEIGQRQFVDDDMATLWRPL
jgi:asparagine synthase (glutamine-hydrolysing)